MLILRATFHTLNRLPGRKQSVIHVGEIKVDGFGRPRMQNQKKHCVNRRPHAAESGRPISEEKSSQQQQQHYWKFKKNWQQNWFLIKLCDTPRAAGSETYFSLDEWWAFEFIRPLASLLHTHSVTQSPQVCACLRRVRTAFYIYLDCLLRRERGIKNCTYLVRPACIVVLAFFSLYYFYFTYCWLVIILRKSSWKSRFKAAPLFNTHTTFLCACARRCWCCMRPLVTRELLMGKSAL